jgi:hypothetical protein
VFQPDSGHTHYFNPIASAALRELGERAYSIPELTERIAARLQRRPDASLARSVRSFAEQLFRLGLIASVDGPAAVK